MHKLQPKHAKLNSKDVADLLTRLNVSLSQLPKISLKDTGVPEGCVVGDVLRIERQTELGDENYFRVIA